MKYKTYKEYVEASHAEIVEIANKREAGELSSEEIDKLLEEFNSTHIGLKAKQIDISPDKDGSKHSIAFGRYGATYEEIEKEVAEGSEGFQADDGTDYSFHPKENPKPSRAKNPK
jgi:hypothetical protein